MSKIKDIIENPHEVYKQNLNYWNFLLQSFEGGRDYCLADIPKDSSQNKGLLSWLFTRVKVDGKELSQNNIDGNLFMHPKEKVEAFNRRLSMSYYYNFCAPIIDIYTNHLFKQPVEENFGNIKKEVEERVNNIDLQDSSITEFRKEISEISQIYGHVFVMVDSPVVSNQIYSLQDKIDANAFPYFSIYHPQNVINWALDDHGKPYWVMLRIMQETNIDPQNYDKEKVSEERYILITRDEWLVYNSKYEQISEGTNPLGEVNLVCILDKKSKRYRNFFGISFLSDIAFIARNVYNSCSELHQILRDQTFAFLAMQGTSDEYNELSIGTSLGLLYPPERAMPAYISPPSSNAEVYFRHIDRQISKMFQIAKLEGGTASFDGQTAVQQSGVSKAWDFNQTNSALSKKASNMEDGEMKLWSMFAKWEGKDFDGSVQYPTEFSVKSLNEDLDEAEKMLKLNIGKIFNDTIKESIIRKRFPRMPEEEIKKLISNMTETPEKNEQTETPGVRISNRLTLFKQNANQAGKNGGSNESQS